MAKRASGPGGAQDGYWAKRVRSAAFRRELTAVVAREIAALSTERVRDVIDPERVRKMIHESDRRFLDGDVVVDLVIEGNRSAANTLKKRGQSVLGLLDAQLVAGIEALLAEDISISRHAEEFVATLMRQEFVRRLFTDIIFTSIVSFYDKVNPLFGGVAMRALEDQIKAFIRLFMPMLEQQATAFAVSKENQRILIAFGRAMVRQLLDEPLPHYAGMISSGQRRKARALIRKAVENASLASLVRDITLAVWDDLYASIRNKRIRDLVQLEQHADWLAEQTAAVIIPTLSRPHIARFMASEIEGAAAERK